MFSVGSAGTAQSRKINSDVTEARSENFPSTSRVENPSVAASTRNPRIPSGVRAHTIATSAMEPFVIQALVPFRTHASPRRSARVSIPVGSEP